MEKKHIRRWIIIGVILLLVLIWIIRFFSSNDVQTQTARVTTMEDKIKVSAIYIRDESVYTTKNGGVLLGRVQSGDKIAVGTHIATLYQGGLDESAKQEIEAINARIEMLGELDKGNDNFSSDINAIEDDVKRGVSEVANLTFKNDLTNLDIAMLNLKEIMNMGSGGVIDAEIKSLVEKRDSIEKSITTPNEKIYAKEAGIFIPFSDGYEEKFNMDDYDLITVNDINDCIGNAENIKSNVVKEYAKNSDVCKTVNNTEWMLACVLKKEEVYGLKKDQEVKIRITESGDTVKAKVIKLFSEDDENFICVVKAGSAIKNAYSNRVCEIEIIKKSYNGISLPAGALRFEDGVAGVYVNSNGIARFKKVDILYSDDDVVIVKSTTKSGMIRMYDEVILDRDGITEGKAVK